MERGDSDQRREFLSDKFDLNKRDFNSKIERWMTLGLLEMVNNHYCLTRLGKEYIIH
jgi:hypothetical protein